MKLLCTGDWHITNKTPRSRLDDYQLNQSVKIKWIINTAIEEGCQYIIQPGDLFDHWMYPDYIKSVAIRSLEIKQEYSIKILSVPGQHDLRYHTSPIVNTPFGVLDAAGKITVLSDEPFIHNSYENVFRFYGAPWGKSIPDPKDSGFNILVTHRMIVLDKLWAEQENYEVAGSLLRKHSGYDLIVSGDNHQSFSMTTDDRWLINCGSLMRSNIDQIEHEPCVWIFDTDEREADKILIPIAPSNEIFNMEEVEEKVERNESLEKLTAALKSKSGLKGLDFKRRLSNRASMLREKEELSPRGEEIIGEMLR